MKRFALWTTAAGAGAAIALFDLLTGWTAHIGAGVFAVLFGLFGLAVALYIGMIRSGLQDRRELRAETSDPAAVLSHATRSIRWCGTFALLSAILLFANCSGVLAPTQDAPQTSAHVDPISFAVTTAILVIPFLLVLVLAPVFANLTRPQLALWSVIALAVVAPLSLVVAFYTGAVTCGELGTLRVGACAASAGSATDFLSMAALALYLPYVGLITSAVKRTR